MKKSALGTKVKKHTGFTSLHKLHLYLSVGPDNCLLMIHLTPRNLEKDFAEKWGICLHSMTKGHVIWRRVLSKITQEFVLGQKSTLPTLSPTLLKYAMA